MFPPESENPETSRISVENSTSFECPRALSIVLLNAKWEVEGLFHSFTVGTFSTYRFTSFPYLFQLDELKALYLSHQLTSDAKLIDDMYSRNYSIHWKDATNEIENAMRDLPTSSSADKTVYYNIYSFFLSDNDCNMHQIRLNVKIPGENLYFDFPKDFNTPMTWMVSRRQLDLYYKLSSASAFLRQLGLVQSTQTFNNASQIIHTQIKRKRCEKSFQTRIRAPAYDEPLGRLRDLVTLFLLLWAGYGISVGCLVLENVGRIRDEGSEGEKRKEFYEIDSEDKKCEIVRVLLTERVDSSVVDDLFSRLFARWYGIFCQFWLSSCLRDNLNCLVSIFRKSEQLEAFLPSHNISQNGAPSSKIFEKPDSFLHGANSLTYPTLRILRVSRHGFALFRVQTPSTISIKHCSFSSSDIRQLRNPSRSEDETAIFRFNSFDDPGCHLLEFDNRFRRWSSVFLRNLERYRIRQQTGNGKWQMDG